jgi:hypothetical protein
VGLPRSEDKLWLQTDATKNQNVSCRRTEPAELSPDVATEFSRMSVTSGYDKEDGRMVSEGEDTSGFNRRAAAVL